MFFSRTLQSASVQSHNLRATNLVQVSSVQFFIHSNLVVASHCTRVYIKFFFFIASELPCMQSNQQLIKLNVIFKINLRNSKRRRAKDVGKWIESNCWPTFHVLKYITRNVSLGLLAKRAGTEWQWKNTQLQITMLQLQCCIAAVIGMPYFFLSFFSLLDLNLLALLHENDII